MVSNAIRLLPTRLAQHLLSFGPSKHPDLDAFQDMQRAIEDDFHPLNERDDGKTGEKSPYPANVCYELLKLNRSGTARYIGIFQIRVVSEC
jgi:hypothetical protein